jgi:membrane-associated phospholipid phosphatase
MTSRRQQAAGWSLLLAIAAAGCADQPTALRRVPGVELSAVKFWDVTASTRWNQRANQLMGVRPPPNAQAWSSRMLTYLSIAQYRAALAAEAGKETSMHPSVSAAVGGASAAVLAAFFPLDVASIESQLTSDLATPGWPGEQNDDPAAGVAIGRAVGAAVIAWSATDHYFVDLPGVPPLGPGNWRSAAGVATVRSLIGTRPFLLTSPDEIRPGPPPAFDSPEYLSALAEIRQISDTRTPEQISIAQFYAWGTAPFTPGNLNLIADQVIADHHRTETEAARILAYANAAAFDAQLACFDAKFTYWFVRPTQADPGITLAIPLPNHPSYPSGHSCVTAGLMTVLIDAFPSERDKLNNIITQAGLSRMYGGLHYRFDIEAGQIIGRRAAALAHARPLE